VFAKPSRSPGPLQQNRSDTLPQAKSLSRCITLTSRLRTSSTSYCRIQVHGLRAASCTRDENLVQSLGRIRRHSYDLDKVTRARSRVQGNCPALPRPLSWDRPLNSSRVSEAEKSKCSRAALIDSSYTRPPAFCWAFFCRRGRRDLFLGGSLPFFTDFVEGLALASEASPPKTVAADSFLSAISLRFAN
jgi:hypothetical protein